MSEAVCTFEKGTDGFRWVVFQEGTRFNSESLRQIAEILDDMNEFQTVPSLNNTIRANLKTPNQAKIESI